jgi:hypothetical protein
VQKYFYCSSSEEVARKHENKECENAMSFEDSIIGGIMSGVKELPTERLSNFVKELDQKQVFYVESLDAEDLGLDPQTLEAVMDNGKWIGSDFIRLVEYTDKKGRTKQLTVFEIPGPKFVLSTAAKTAGSAYGRCTMLVQKNVPNKMVNGVKKRTLMKIEFVMQSSKSEPGRKYYACQLLGYGPAIEQEVMGNSTGSTTIAPAETAETIDESELDNLVEDITK